jgi:hypothetical protein
MLEESREVKKKPVTGREVKQSYTDNENEWLEKLSRHSTRSSLFLELLKMVSVLMDEGHMTFDLFKSLFCLNTAMYRSS